MVVDANRIHTGFQSPPREGRIALHLFPAYRHAGFQSPPREGRIPFGASCPTPPECFQSPPREGRILVPWDIPHRQRQVSSHLPARGGSTGRLGRQQCRMGFQSPPREGRIFWAACAILLHRLFPVTSPRGEDRASNRRSRSLCRFPVTSPRGEDPLQTLRRVHYRGFQSPPREGRITAICG